MKQTFKILTIRYIGYSCITFAATAFCYAIYQYTTGGEIGMSRLVKTLVPAAAGLGLLAEARRTKNKADEEKAPK